MMTIRQLAEYIAAEPFRPFRIKLASGQSYEIRHPEMILVGRTSVRVNTYPEPGTGMGATWHDLSLLWHDLSLLLVEALEPIASAVA
jgi:hypothetical protein